MAYPFQSCNRTNRTKEDSFAVEDLDTIWSARVIESAYCGAHDAALLPKSALTAICLEYANGGSLANIVFECIMQRHHLLLLRG